MESGLAILAAKAVSGLESGGAGSSTIYPQPIAAPEKNPFSLWASVSLCLNDC